MFKKFLAAIRGKCSETPAKEQEVLREQMAQVHHQLAIAEAEFNLLQDDTLLEPLIYRIKALNLQYNRLLGLARQEAPCHHFGTILEQERVGGRMG